MIESLTQVVKVAEAVKQVCVQVVDEIHLRVLKFVDAVKLS